MNCKPFRATFKSTLLEHFLADFAVQYVTDDDIAKLYVTLSLVK